MMYTSLENVQIIISLLKQHGVKYLVLSPGTRNAPFVHSVETDPFFVCYSIVDERSAAYFALGLSEAMDVPVGFSCTSSTAACNYLPAIEEAHRKSIQLIALTADRDMRRLYQMEDQMIDQVGMYRRYTRCSVNLPIVNDKEDIWFCVRSVNEALLELNHAGKGPVQINYQVTNVGTFPIDKLPVYRMITRVEHLTEQSILPFQQKLANKKRILVLCGEYYCRSKGLLEALKIFAEKYHAVVSYDYFSNITDDSFLKTLVVTEAMDNDEFQGYLPDVVITIGNQVWSFIKYKLRENGSKIEHWRVAPDGKVIDGLNALSTVFECTPELFFQVINKGDFIQADNQYYLQWKSRINTVLYPELKFTNFSVLRDFTKRIPDGSLLHLSILNSIRLTNFGNLGHNVRCFANLGADGIDGSMSTFFGQSNAEEFLSFLVIGDLSFLYDLNITLKPMKKNQRILVINNFAGGEFHNNFGLNYISTLNQHIAAGHHTKISEWVDIMKVKYLSAENQMELEEQLAIFTSESEVPMLLEVFTDADTDAKILKSYYAVNRKLTAKNFIKKVIKKILRILTGKQ